MRDKRGSLRFSVDEGLFSPAPMLPERVLFLAVLDRAVRDLGEVGAEPYERREAINWFLEKWNPSEENNEERISFYQVALELNLEATQVKALIKKAVNARERITKEKRLACDLPRY